MLTKTKSKLIEELFAPELHTSSYGMEAIYVPATQWLNAAQLLKEQLEMDFLVCESGVDWPDKGIELYAHLRTSATGEEMVLKTMVSRNEHCEIDSLYALWPTAELYEDELYDLLGVGFKNHPFLRRIMLYDTFNGYPLRKDYGKVSEH